MPHVGKTFGDGALDGESHVLLRILGPVELWAGERRHPLGAPRLGGILACLALNVGQTVSIDDLMERLGGGRAKRSTIHSYITQLRKALRSVADEVRIEHRGRGYVLRADPDQIDYHRFLKLRRRAAAAERNGGLDEALAYLREAEELWTGRALEGLPGEWTERIRLRLEEERLAVTISRIRLELRLGHTGGLTSELRSLVAEKPLDERLAELLMRALHASGQTAQALDEYLKIRQRLVDGAGHEPGRALRELHQQILNDDLDEPPVENGADPPPTPSSSPPPLNNLQRSLADFVGRRTDIEELVAAFADPTPGRPGVITIHGMPAVGKSTFANELAHRLLSSYPDAAIHVDLGAYGPRGPLDPSIVLADLLSRFGVSIKRAPTVEDRAGLWRTYLTNQSVLLLLDDASGYEQVRHLLPGSSTSLVIITSRHRLTGLDGAWPVSLRPLLEDESASLLREIVARGQLDDEDAMRRVLNQCAGVPLAIRLAANRLRARTAHTILDLAQRLDHTSDLLGEFRDDQRSMRVSFELSYRVLPEPRKRAFRLLSLHPAGDFTHHAAAAILDEPLHEVVPVIDHLLDDHLIEEHSRGRLRYHDLLRGYARERTEEEDGTAVRAACRDRLGDYFLATAEQADAVLRPFARRRRLPGVRPGAEVSASMPDAEEAKRRMEMEISGLIAYAQREYLRRPEIAHAAAAYLDTTARWNEAADIHEKAILGWREAGNPAGEAAAMVDLSHMRLRCSRLTEAVDIAREALATFRSVGDAGGEADALDRLGLASLYTTQYAQAIEHFGDSAALRRGIGDEKGEADAFAHSGQALYFRGHYANALLMLERALATYSRIGDAQGRLEALNNLGEVQLRLNRPRDALRSYTQSMNVPGAVERRQDKAIQLANAARCHLALESTDKALALFHGSLDICRDIIDLIGIADALDGIGSVHRASGDKKMALTYYQEALDIAREIPERLQTCRTLRNIGTLHSEAGDHRRAVEPLEESLSLARTIEDPYEMALSLAMLGRCLAHVGRATEGRMHVAESEALMRSLGVDGE